MNPIEFTPQQQTIVEEICSGNSIPDALVVANTTPRDFHAWRRHLPFFAEVLEQALADRDFMHREKAVTLIDLAYQALGDILRNDKASPSLKFKAAKFIIEQAKAPAQAKEKNADVPALPLYPTSKSLQIAQKCTTETILPKAKSCCAPAAAARNSWIAASANRAALRPDRLRWRAHQGRLASDGNMRDVPGSRQPSRENAVLAVITEPLESSVRAGNFVLDPGFRREYCKSLKRLVGASGFEPPTSWSRTGALARLSHAPILLYWPWPPTKLAGHATAPV